MPMPTSKLIMRGEKKQRKGKKRRQEKEGHVVGWRAGDVDEQRTTVAAYTVVVIEQARAAGGRRLRICSYFHTVHYKTEFRKTGKV